jgi:hypothetical protein
MGDVLKYISDPGNWKASTENDKQPVHSTTEQEVRTHENG